MSEKEVQQEIEKAKEEVAKGDFTNANWEYLLPMLLMFFMPFGKEDNKGKEKRGETLYSKEYVGVICSCCNRTFSEAFIDSYSYCPYCGANIEKKHYESEAEYNARTCGAKEEPKTDTSDQSVLKNFVDTAQQKLKDMLEKFDEDEFQKYLIHAIATEIEEIKKKQTSVENCIAALQSTVQYIMIPQCPYMPSYMPFYIPTPPYGCTQNTETQSQDLANKSEKES